MKVVCVGSKAEKKLTENIKINSSVPIFDLAGSTTLPQLISVLKKAQIVISNDTGPGHIGAAMDVPIVMIFGRSNPARVAPYGDSGSIAAVEPYDRGFNSDSVEPRHDIKAIAVDDVYKKVCEQIGNRHSP